MDVVEQLVDGRRAYEERAWATAYQRLSALDPGTLEDDDCLALSTAAYLAGDRETSARALEESYRRHTEAGSLLAAARDTFWLGLLYNTTGNVTVGNGWAARGARLLQDAAPDAAEHAYLWVHQMYGHIFAGDFPGAHELAVRIAETGRRCGDANLVSVGLSSQGRLLIYLGQVREGLALLDEAMVGLADAGRLADPRGALVLLDGGGVPGDRRLAANGRLDDGPHAVVPDAAGDGALHRAVRGAPGADHAVPGRPARGPRGAGAGSHPVRRGGLDAGSGARPVRAGRRAADPG